MVVGNVTALGITFRCGSGRNDLSGKWKIQMKNSITLVIIQRNGGRKDVASRYRVASLSNRMEPEVGSLLSGEAVDALI